jgi:integrase
LRKGELLRLRWKDVDFGNGTITVRQALQRMSGHLVLVEPETALSRRAVRLHDLRHGCASLLLAAGASPRTVMKTLGHSQVGLTMNTYTHVLPEAGRAAMDAAAKAMFE